MWANIYKKESTKIKNTNYLYMKISSIYFHPPVGFEPSIFQLEALHATD